MDLDEIEQDTRLLIMELILVLYNHGIDEIHFGGLLRLLGVDEETARESDDEKMYVEEKLVDYIAAVLGVDSTETEIHNQTIH